MLNRSLLTMRPIAGIIHKYVCKLKAQHLIVEHRPTIEFDDETASTRWLGINLLNAWLFAERHQAFRWAVTT
jgi:hypothetical protein